MDVIYKLYIESHLASSDQSESSILIKLRILIKVLKVVDNNYKQNIFFTLITGLEDVRYVPLPALSYAIKMCHCIYTEKAMLKTTVEACHVFSS